MNPLVSILITSFNTGRFIKEAIESVFEQTHENWELVIVDDASTDDTQVIINQFDDPRIRKIFNEKNIGYVASKNLLLQEMKGEFGCFLDADDWMAPDRVEKQLKVFSEYPETGACMCNYFRVSQDGTISAIDFFNRSKFLNTKEDSLEFAGAGILFRKEVITKVGLFEKYFDKLLGDDSYWAFRIAENFPFYYLEEPLYYYRANTDSITATFNNLRKLSIVELLRELKQQRRKTGTDWLEQKNYDKALAYEQGFLNNRKWVSEKYRLIASVRLDYKDVETAGRLLKKSWRLNPFSFNFYRTLFYYFTTRVNSGKA
jgi:glycosyltransferase involved in cell wall biosynthesis